jgi:hypothetical protein
VPRVLNIPDLFHVSLADDVCTFVGHLREAGSNWLEVCLF